VFRVCCESKECFECAVKVRSVSSVLWKLGMFRVCCQNQEVQNCWCRETNIDVFQKHKKQNILNWTALQISWRCERCVNLARISQVQNVRTLGIPDVCSSSLHVSVCDSPTNQKCAWKLQLPFYWIWCSFSLYFRSWPPSVSTEYRFMTNLMNRCWNRSIMTLTAL